MPATVFRALADFCGKPLLEWAKVFSFGSFGLFRSLRKEDYAVKWPINEKAPAGTRVFFCISLLLPGGAESHQSRLTASRGFVV